MAKNSFQFDVALGRNNYIPIGEVKQSDTMDFSIRVLENDVVKNLTGDTCTLYVSKQDGTILEQKEGINITEATSGTLTIRVKNQATACPGMAFFELEFKGADGIATSGTFLFTVNARVASGEAIQSKDEIQALEQVEKYVKEAKAELQKFKELQTSMLETNNSINSQEASRTEAERLRVEAEKGRIAAETKREEAFNKFEGRITANTEELEAARTATSGENFNSIDERIDCEVNRINKKIEISFLEQEAKESHVIENTIEGMTTDMRIGGRTLVNLFTVSRSNIAEHNKQCVCENDNKDIYNNKQYSLINLISRSIAVNIYKKNPEGYLRTINIPGNSIKTITLNENEYVYSNNGVFDGSEWNGTQEDLELLKQSLLVLEGDWIDKPTPSYFEGIKSLGEQEGNKISILSTGKNLFDKSQYSKYENQNGDLEFTAIGNTRVNNFFYIFKEKNYRSEAIFTGSDSSAREFTTLNQTKYYILVGLNGDKQDNKVWGEIILPPNTKCYYSTTNEKGDNFVRFKNIQIEVGTSKTNYKSYKEDKKDILLSKYGFDEGLRGLNKTVFDELNSIKNIAIKRIGKYTFNGNENISIFQPNHTNCLSVVVENVIESSSDGIKSDDKMCDKFKWADTYSEDVEGFNIHFNNVRFNILKTKLPSPNVEGFKEWLKTNVTTIYYVLADPVETPLIENINSKTFGEKTYVSFENSLSGTSSFKAPVNAAATISRLNRENKALEEENLRLKKDTYKNSEDIILTNEELQITQSAVDHLLFGAVGTAMLYNGKKEGGGSMGAYLAMRIIKGKLKYDAVMKQYGEFKEDIDLILEAEGYGHLITQQ